MSKFFYINKKIISRLVVLAIVLFFISGELSVLFILISALYLFLHKRKQINFTHHRTTGKEILVSPISGLVKEITEKEKSIEIEVNVALKNDCGIFMPFKGEVTNYLEIYSAHLFLSFLGVKNVKTSVGLTSNSFPDVKLKIYGLTIFRKPELFVRAGDRASTGGLIGYLPYGGKIVISVPKRSEVLVSEGDRVTSFQTLIAKYKGQNDK